MTFSLIRENKKVSQGQTRHNLKREQECKLGSVLMYEIIQMGTYTEQLILFKLAAIEALFEVQLL